MSSSEPAALWDLPEEPPAAPKAAPSRARKSKAPKPGQKAKGAQQPAPERPVARIVVDIPLAHLDRTFDYLVPEKLHETAVPGCRVRVRFAGQLVDGYLIERGETSDYGSKLAFLDRVTSAEQVLPPSLHTLCRAVADRYGGTLSDVLRLAIPPRHAKAEGEPPLAARGAPGRAGHHGLGALPAWPGVPGGARRGQARERRLAGPAGRGLAAPAGRGRRVPWPRPGGARCWWCRTTAT